MKKYILTGIACAAALLSATSCNQDLLNIPQKGVIAYEDFYQTADDAQSALITAYAKMAEIEGNLGGNSPSFNAVTNAGGDELYWGGSKKEDNTDAQEINEFRSTYTNNNAYAKRIYNHLYSVIYRANLVIDNFYGEDGKLCDSDVKKQCVAEARAIRAWSHFYLAILFYNPPLVDHVLNGDARPTNCDHEELLKWVASEFEAVVNDIPARKGPNDKKGAVRFTKGAVQAYLGKVQLFLKDYNGAKKNLKEVINSGNYALVPTSELGDLFHGAGDGNCEKVFEFNYVDHENVSLKVHYQRNSSLYFRQLKNFPDQTLQVVGWGNNMGPTEKFVNAMLENEPESARRKNWFISYEDLLGNNSYSALDYHKDGTPLTKEEKLMDENRGLELKKYNDLYANCGYFWIKFLPYQSDLVHNSTTQTDENRCQMRYADVLLMYAEACAMTNDNDGLQYLQQVQKRAEAPVSQTLTMDAVKKERWFELAWEGQRFFDLVRWGVAAKELAFKGTTDMPYLSDDFYVYGTLGKEKTGRPHMAVIYYKDDGWKAKGAGFKAGKHEYMPIPFSSLEVNDELKQNPYWAD